MELTGRTKVVSEARRILDFVVHSLREKSRAAYCLGMDELALNLSQRASDIEEATEQLYDCWYAELNDHVETSKEGSTNMLNAMIAGIQLGEEDKQK
jgi:hypothetical protein